MTQNRQDAAPKRATAKRRSSGAAKRKANGAGGEPLAAEQVAAYLRDNPGFFLDNPDLLSELKPPARDVGHGVVDLQQFMVERLRGELADMATARDALVVTARNNLSAQSRVHKAILAILAARNFEQFIEILTTDLAVILDLDVVTVGVEQTEEEETRACTAGVFRLEPGTVDDLLGVGQSIVLRANVPGDSVIFGEGSGLIASDALIRLSIGGTTPPAVLALGSRDPDQFNPGQGTELMAFLARVVENCIRGWLTPPE